MEATLHVRRFIVGGLLVAATGCSTAKPKPEEKPVQQVQVEKPKPAAVPGQLSARTQRAFDDSVAAYQAASHARTPDYSDAERKFKQVIAMDDTLAEAYFNMGVIYEREHKPEQAEEMYKTALAKKPSLRQASENLAVMQENAGKPEQAIQMYQQMAQRYPQDGGSRARLAALYAQVGQGEEALRLAREALMRDPKNVTAYKVKMRVYLDQKKVSLAQLVALRATHLDASDPELYQTIGMILLHQGDEFGAIEQFHRAVKERDDYLPARVELAKIAIKHHDYASAAAQYEKMVQLLPSNAAAHLDLGIAYKGMGQVDKAFQQYEEAKKLDESNAEVYYALGVVFEKNKSLPDKALEYYKLFIQKSGTVAPDHPVYESIKTCEQLVALAQQAKEQEEQQKKQAELEAKNKAAAEKKTPTPGAGGAVAPAAAQGNAPKAQPASATKGAAAPAPAPAPKAAPPAADEPKAHDASDEPPDAAK